MTPGIQIYNSNGTLWLDMSGYLLRFHSEHYAAAGSTGAITGTLSNGGQMYPWYCFAFVLPYPYTTTGGITKAPCRVWHDMNAGGSGIPGFKWEPTGYSGISSDARILVLETST